MTVHIAVIVPINYRPVSLAAIMDVFTTVNRFHRMSNRPEPFNIRQFEYRKGGASNIRPLLQTAANSENTVTTRAEADKKIPDLILIPAFTFADINQTLDLNKMWISWLKECSRMGSEVASFCTGSFLAAAAGLLDGRTATTHLMYSDAFRQLFPKAKLEKTAVVTDDGGVYTSGGATSSFHLMLHLIRKYCGNETSIQIAKIFAIDLDRNTQAYFQEFKPETDHKDQLISQLQKEIEESYQDNISITEIADNLPASRRTLYRRFKKVTGITPHIYLQKIRIEKAKQLLENGNFNVSEVMYRCGYSDSKSFRKIFKKNTGLTPNRYRKKYHPVV